jgi:serine/threonine-protein kinase
MTREEQPAPKAPEKPDPLLGQVLNGRYLIELKIGKGGFGAVYRGLEQGSNRPVALKLLHPTLTRDTNLVARFKREGEVACNLRHPNTITTYEFTQTREGVLYIAMELLTGRSLDRVLADEGPLLWSRVFGILTQMCGSLGEAHEQGIVHRDIKPENIHLEEREGLQDFVKLLDFGIAKIVGGEGAGLPQLTLKGQTLGTLEFMSPEQLKGKALDGRSDIYAMGVVAFELLTDRLPQMNLKEPEAPSRTNPEARIPQGVDYVVRKMLQQDRERRYLSVEDLRRDLGEVLETEGRPPARATSEPIAAQGGWLQSALRAFGIGRRG